MLVSARAQDAPLETESSVSRKFFNHFFIVVPCILIALKFLSPTNALFITHIKCYNIQLKYLMIAPTCFGPHGP